MIGRIVWFAALAAIAGLVIVLQIDKQSEAEPQLAALVPEPMRNYAQVHVVRTALTGEDPAAALAEAERLVRRRPIPAEYLALLAAGQAKAGREEAALQTIQVAGGRGWREPATQEAMLRLALIAGDRPEAARRYAALFLRNGTPESLLREVGPAVLDGPDSTGRETMAAIVTGGTRWHPLFLRRAPNVMSPAAFSAITAASLRGGAAFDCGAIRRSAKALERSSAPAAATIAAAAAERCP